jgi:hypothetical protein
MKNTSLKLRIRPEVAAKLRYYVYVYVDPRDSQIFYVGKGCRGRALAHLDEGVLECEKPRRIAELKAAGLSPRIDILAHGMEDEETALRVEAAAIDILRPAQRLTNRVRGHRAIQFGRAPLSELDAIYGAKPVTIAEPCLLIRINKLYRPGMTTEALYEATRGVWKVGKRRNRAQFALAVYQGVVRQAYEIQEWHVGGTIPYSTRARDDVDAPDRWEFTGVVAERLAVRYCGGSVEKYLPTNAQNPIVYVNC